MPQNSALETETLRDCLAHYLPVLSTTVDKKLFQKINFSPGPLLTVFEL